MKINESDATVEVAGQTVPLMMVADLLEDLLNGRAVIVQPCDRQGEAYVIARNGEDGDRYTVGKRKVNERHVGLYARQVRTSFGGSRG